MRQISTKHLNERRREGKQLFKGKDPTLAVTIITTSKYKVVFDYDPKYLTQTVASFLKLINADKLN